MKDIALKDKHIRYAIFDMDGTLVESMVYWRSVIDEVVDILGVVPEKRLEVRNALQVMTEKQIEKYLNENGLIPEGFDLNKISALSIMKEHYEKDVTVRPGAKELLDALHSQGVRMGIATLTPTPLTELCLKKFDLYDYFEFFYTSLQYPKGKSTPLIFWDAAKHFGTAVEEMWLFEDSLYSVETAKSLGMRIAVTEDDTQRNNFEKLYEKADVYFKNGFTERTK